MSKTLIASAFGVGGLSLSAGLVTYAVTDKKSESFLKKCEKLKTKELEEIFTKIKSLYEVFKSNYEALKEKVKSYGNNVDIEKINKDSCFDNYWNLNHNLLTPLIANTKNEKNDSKIKELNKSAESLADKIEEFNKKKDISIK